MESKTKVKLSAQEIQCLVDDAFQEQPVRSVRELTDGYFNTAYEIQIGAHGQQTVLKVGPPADVDILVYEKNLLYAEVESMKLAASDPEIPVPRINHADFSRSRLPYEYYFMEFLQGTTWDKLRDKLSTEQNERLEFRLGEITARINAFEGAAFGYFAFGREFDNWPDAFHWMCSLVFADARRFQIPLALSEKAFFDQFETHRSIFVEVARPQLVHWDLWAGNVFVTVNNGSPRIEGIVDFERALWGDPLMEVYLGRLKGIPAYMAGYGSDLLATKTQRLRRIFYNIYLHLIMIVEDGPRQYKDKGTVKWAQERLREDIEMLREGDVNP